MSILGRFVLRFAGFYLDVDLELPGQGVSALYGPSGSGKTTVLRCLAGLERAAGRLVVDGQVWQDDRVFLPPYRRPIGYVFQDASLFAHLDVKENLAYGMARTGATGRVDREAILDLLGIGHLLDRGVDRLSGGERQRVAIARAVMTAPRLLLMDEPLTALDAARKREVLPYLTRLRDELAIPIIYVSHSPDEVGRLADHLVLMDGGRVLGSGPITAMSARLDLPLAQDDEGGVVLDTVVGGHDDEYSLTGLDCPAGRIWVPRRDLPLGYAARLRILASDVSIALDDATQSSIVNRLPARVTGVGPTGDPAQVLIGLEANGMPLVARITRRSLDMLHLEPGKSVLAQIKSSSLLT